MVDPSYAPGVRVLRVPDGPTGRVDRYVADATGMSRSYVQKLISDGRLTVGRRGAPRERDRRPRRRSCTIDVPEPIALDLEPAPEIAAAGRLRGRGPAGHRQAGRARRPPGARSFERHAGQRAPGARRRRDLGRHRRRPAAGHRPSPRPRHERAADGRPDRRRAGLDHGPAQGPPDQEDVPGARPGQRGRRRRPDRGADRARPEAPDEDGGRARRPPVGHRLSRSRAVRRLDPARARPGDRADAPDPGPSRRHRPPGRRRSGLRHRHVAARAGRARPAVPPCLAARADVAVGRPPHPRDGAAAARARERSSTACARSSGERRLEPGRGPARGQRRDARHHLGAERASGRTRSSTRCGAGRTTPTTTTS